jgi:hypothetical protein
MATISASVGRGGRNLASDVVVVKGLLNANLHQLVPFAPLSVDGTASPEMLAAIAEFQRRALRIANPDGRVDPGGRTLSALNGEPVDPLAGVDWGRAQPAPKSMWSLVGANFPFARNLGIYNNRNVAGTSTPSAHAEGRALDIGLLVNVAREKTLGDRLFDIFIRDAAEIGMDHVIWDQQIWSPQRPRVRSYTGQNPHTDHIHLAWTRAGSQLTQWPTLIMHFGQLRTGMEELRSFGGRGNAA